MTLDETELVVDEGDGGFTPFMLIYDEAGPEDARYLIAANLRRGYEEDSATLTKEGETPERLMWPLRMGLGSEPGPVLRNPSLPCYDDGSTAFGMIGAISAAAFEADSHTGSLSVTINAQDRKCDGTRRNPKSYVNVSGTVTLIPIFIEHPRDVEGGANRTAESQFVYDDSNPGALEIEYRLSTPEAGLTSFLEENIRWSAHRVDDCFMNIDDWEVDYTWPNQDDKWYPVTDPKDPYGKGTSATVRFERLPSCNEGFGRRIVRMDVLNPDTGERGTSLADRGSGYLFAGRAEYEVFFNRTATNHPGPDRIFAGSSCADMPAGTERQENWLNYWSQTVNVDGGLRGSDLEYAWSNQTNPRTDLGPVEVPRISRWDCYDRGPEDVVFYESGGGYYSPGRVGTGMVDTDFTGIHYLAGMLFHEYSHIRQIRCYNQCGAVASTIRPERPFYNPSPLQFVATSQPAALGWSFDPIRGQSSDANAIASGWNHFWTATPVNPAIDLTLDDFDTHMCDHNPSLANPATNHFYDFCHGLDADCVYHPPGSPLGGSVCDDLSGVPTNPGDRGEYFERFALEVENAARPTDPIGIDLKERDWACPGKQHAAALESHNPNDPAPTQADCY